MQTLKIDKSFIDLLSTEKEEAALIASIIDMAHVLGLVVVAEGVETSQQLERLVRCDCDTIQGYLVSPALPAAAAMSFLQEWKGSADLKTGELNG